MSLSTFGFVANWSPYLIYILLLVVIGYFYLIGSGRSLFKESEPVGRKEKAYFLSGILLLYIVKGSPMDLLGHIMFSVHMAQMAILLLLIPILLMKGIPWWVWEGMFRNQTFARLFNFVTKPLLALIVFSAFFSIYHIPMVLDQIKMNEALHTAVTFALFLTAFFMWWSVIDVTRNQKTLHGLKKIGFIIGSAVLITPACALIIFASNPMYATYTDADAWLKAMELCVPAETLSGLTLSGPELFSAMSAIEDQQLGGIIMKIIQELIYAVLLSSVFFAWYKNEQENADEITEQALRDLQSKA